MLLKNNPENLGSEIIPFSLKGTDDNIYTEEYFSDAELAVIIFMCNHCPYVIAVIERLIKLQEKYAGKKVKFVGINPNDAVQYPRDSFENMKIFSSENKMNFPYLADETQQIARQYDAVCTPDIFVYDKSRKLKYRGRLDDNWKNEGEVKSRELEKAIELLLEKKEIDFTQYPSMGCSIKWKK